MENILTHPIFVKIVPQGVNYVNPPQTVAHAIQDIIKTINHVINVLLLVHHVQTKLIV